MFYLPIFRKARPSFFRVLRKNLKKEDRAFRNIGKRNIYSQL